MQGIIVPPFIPTPEQVAERERIVSARYFLVKQGSLGEIYRCRRCKLKHRYLTLMCREQPFNGAEGGLFAYVKVVGPAIRRPDITTAEKLRYERVKQLFPGLISMPDIADYHPASSRNIVGIGDRDAYIGSVALGILEPITKAEAQKLLKIINIRGGKLTVPGLEP
jgi:hypothetical protein